MKILDISFEKSVGGVIFRKEDGRTFYLLLNYLSGHWDFPKGHVEQGETEIETLRREVEEETGISDIEVSDGFKTRMGYFYRAKGSERMKRERTGRGINIIKQVIYYLARTSKKDVVISHEHTGFVWLEFDEALERLTFEKSKNILRKAEEELQK